MSQRAILIIIFCLLALTTAVEHGKKHHRRCGENEQYSKSGSDCLTCENLNTTCPIVNEEKCYCLEGFVRDYQNNCINKTECATACKTHEHYTNKSPCEYTCGGTGQIQELRCNCSLASGCVCDKGYVRCDLTRSCVPKGDCYPVCKENEVAGRPWCQSYCENNKVVRPPCPLILPWNCKLSCICREGYIRDRKAGKCIPLEVCTENTSSTDAVITSTSV